jgi:AcrR family transcriptional regulator
MAVDRIGGRAGRRPGHSGTREAILAAARAEFTALGYDGATLRGIAQKAHVNHAMILHFFGSKDDLFVAALEWPFDPQEVVPRVLQGSRDAIGQRLARFYLRQWDDEAARAPIVALLRSAASNEQASRLLRDFAQREMAAQVAAYIDRPDAKIRASLIVGQLVGTTMMRYVLRLEPVASADREAVVEPLGQALQALLVGA